MNYSDLPDYISCKEIELYFMDIIDNNQTADDPTAVFNDVYELADRYWHTYSLINEQLKNKITKFIIENIDYDSFDIMDSVLSIIPLLGLKEVLDEIIDHKNKISDPKILSMLDQAYKEYGKTVEDPYSGMKR